jgi:hypothetical protein
MNYNSEMDLREVGCKGGSGCNWLRILSNIGFELRLLLQES